MPSVNPASPGLAAPAASRSTSHSDNIETTIPVVKVGNKFSDTVRFVMRLTPNLAKDELGVSGKYYSEIKGIEEDGQNRIALVGYDGKSGALAVWKDENTSDDLFTWMSKNPEVMITLKEGGGDGMTKPLSAVLRKINYLTSDQASQYRVHLSENGGWMKNDNCTALNTAELQENLRGKEGMKDHAVIVISRDGKIFVHPYESGVWQHTSTTRGKPVLFAGMVKVENGRLTSLHLDSGHYTPQLKQLKNFLRLITSNGADLRDIEIHAKDADQQELNRMIHDFS